MHFRPRLCGVSCIHLRMETPLCGRSGGHAGTAPTVSFGWIACGRVGFVWVDCVQMVILFVWDCVEKYYGAW